MNNELSVFLMIQVVSVWNLQYAECVWIVRELLEPCCGASPGCLGLDVSQTKACPNKINVFVLLSHSSSAEQTEHGNK